MKQLPIRWVLPWLLLSSCKESPAEVFPLKKLASVETSTTASGEPVHIKNEYFVIAHPPKDRAALRSVIQKYNDKTLPRPELDKYSAVFRVFFRETDYTPRTYAESNDGYFEHDSIDSHARDALVQVKWTRDEAAWEFTFYSDAELP